MQGGGAAGWRGPAAGSAAGHSVSTGRQAPRASSTHTPGGTKLTWDMSLDMEVAARAAALARAATPVKVWPLEPGRPPGLPCHLCTSLPLRTRAEPNPPRPAAPRHSASSVLNWNFMAAGGRAGAGQERSHRARSARPRQREAPQKSTRARRPCPPLPPRVVLANTLHVPRPAISAASAVPTVVGRAATTPAPGRHAHWSLACSATAAAHRGGPGRAQ